MFLKNFKIVLRNLSAQKLFTFINVFGLAVGFAGSLLISVFVWNELSYESMHENRQNIYRIAVQFGREDESMIMPGAMPALGPAAKNELPEVDEYVRIVPDRKAAIQIGESVFEETGFYFADESIFGVFTFDVISQVDERPLSDPFDVLISASTAEKYFNVRNVIGKTIQYNDHLLRVTGVYKDITGNTQIKPDLIASYKTKESIAPVSDQWGTFGRDITYLLLNQKVSPHALEEKVTAILVRNTFPVFADMIRLIPEHFPGIHLNSAAIGDLVQHGNKNYVYLFSTIALFVLLVASLNFINLSTARSFCRAKEVGIKKVLGAQRGQLIAQFLIESLFVIFIALMLGIILYELLHPILTRFLGIPMDTVQLDTSGFYTIVGVTFLAVGLLSGLYPAFHLTRFEPVKTVKNDIGKSFKGIGFRKGLVVVQFVISILLIFGTMVIFRQLGYMQNYDIGLEQENIVLLDYSSTGEDGVEKYETLKSELLRSADIVSVSGVSALPGLGNIEKSTVGMEGTPKDESIIMRFNGVDHSFINTFGIELVAGRDFRTDYPADRNQAVILNRRAVEEFGIDNIVGKRIRLGENFLTVIGVVENFHVESLHAEVEPMVLYIKSEPFYNIAVKISPHDTQHTLDFIESTWHSVLPDHDLNLTFMEDSYQRLYYSEEKISQLFTIFSFLAIYIAALGLFGLASFSAEQRRKEIGIRKILGSTITGVVTLLSRDYGKLVVIASIISLPLSYYFMNQWLQNFAYHVSLSWWMFVLAGGIAIVIALLTVGYQAIRAATANPVESLRYE